MKENIVRKWLILGIIVLFVGASFVPSISGNVGNLNEYNSKQSIVTLKRGILYVGGDGPGNYSSIQNAIDNASNGDTVFVYDYSSPYKENLLVSFKSINLIGEDKKTTFIDGNYIGDTIYIYASDVTIQGFSIIQSNLNYSGILLLASEGCFITDNNIENNGNGVRLQDSSNGNEIYYNNFIDNIQNAYDEGNNIWDDGISLGNYWSDYEEKYPNAKKKWLKGIWDTPYEIPGGDMRDDNIDNYPPYKLNNYPKNKPLVYDFNLLNWCFERFPIVYLLIRNLSELK